MKGSALRLKVLLLEGWVGRAVVPSCTACLRVFLGGRNFARGLRANPSVV